MSKLNSNREQNTRRILYLLGFCAIVVGGIGLFIFTSRGVNPGSLLTVAFGAVLLVTSYFSLMAARYVACLGLVLISAQTVASGYSTGMVGFMIAIGLAGVLINGRAVPVVGVTSVVVYTAVHAIARPQEFSLINVASIASAFLIFSLLMFTFANSQRRTATEADARAADLAAALAQLRQKQALEQQTGSAIISVMQQLGAVSRDQLSGAQEQVAALGQVTTTIEELSQTALQIADAAEEVGGAAEQALRAVDISQAAVNDGLHAMMQIKAQVQQIVERTIALNQRTQSTSDLVNVVAGIAAETHLLALNAAIEAAGAGAAGERFAVVAAQVKKLARRSQQEVGKIRDLVQEVQRANVMSVMATEQGLKDSDKGAQQAKAAAEANLEVISTVNATTLRAKSIVLATQQQRSASNQVVDTMRLLKQNANGVVAAATVIDHSINELSALAAQLGAIIQATSPQQRPDSLTPAVLIGITANLQPQTS